MYAKDEQTESKQLRAELSKQKQQNSNQGQQIHAMLQRREAEQADMRRREREADSKWDRGVRCEQWANRLVGLHGEDGEILLPNAQARALQDLMDHTYGRGSLDSRRVVTAVEAQRWSSISLNPLARGLSTLPVDTSVWYLSFSGTMSSRSQPPLLLLTASATLLSLIRELRELRVTPCAANLSHGNESS